MARPPTPKVASTVNDFVVLPVHMPPQPSYLVEAIHYIYLRAHAPKVPTSTSSRELFLVNVPIDSTDLHIRNLFANQLGGPRVEAVAFEGARASKSLHAPVAPPRKKRKRDSDGLADVNALDLSELRALPSIRDRELHHSGSTALVTFVDDASAALGLKSARKVSRGGKAKIFWENNGDSTNLIGRAQPLSPQLGRLGSARYHANHRARFPDAGALQQHVDASMAAYAAAEQTRAESRARLRSEPDADGFITVTRGGRKAGAREDAAQRRWAEEQERKERQRVRDGFYRFQVRERQKEAARELVRDFEADRRRVEEMRKRRKGKIRPEA